MGGAVSSLHRLRNQFIIRLYKKGLVENSIRSLFESATCTSNEDGSRILTKSDLLQILGVDSSDILDELFVKCRFQDNRIPVDFIVDFLEKGVFTPSTIQTVKKQINSVSIYPEVWDVLRFEQKGACSNAITTYRFEDDNIDTGKDDLSSKRSRSCRSMWKKHETVIQERIVKHTTVDEDGTVNELITTDKSQNDVIHIESKVTGEFAHREYTQQEQTEEMDKDMSTFVRATEEYIHLKSKEDEYEYVHSEVPPQTEQNTSNELDSEDFDSTQRSFDVEDEMSQDTEYSENDVE